LLHVLPSLLVGLAGKVMRPVGLVLALLRLLVRLLGVLLGVLCPRVGWLASFCACRISDVVSPQAVTQSRVRVPPLCEWERGPLACVDHADPWTSSID
jgi:hypothetical protein